MYSKTKQTLKDNKYNRYLLMSILTSGMGSPIFGGIALYNTLQYGRMLEYMDSENNNLSLQKDITKTRKRIKILLDISMFFSGLFLLFVFTFILGTVLTMNDLMNSLI